MQVRGVCDEVRRVISRMAPVVVSSCVGAAQLAEEGVTFGLVVLDEGSQAKHTLLTFPPPSPSPSPSPSPELEPGAQPSA
jgi:hypothetical protein